MEETAVSSRLKNYLISRNISALRLAAAAGIEPETLQALIDGNLSRCSRFDIARLCVALNCNCSDLAAILSK